MSPNILKNVSLSLLERVNEQEGHISNVKGDDMSLFGSQLISAASKWQRKRKHLLQV